MVKSLDKYLKSTFPSMDATACSVLSLEVLWFSGASIMGWCILSPAILTGREVMRRRSFCTCPIPNMAGVKDYFKEQSREEKVLSGWSVTIWDYAHLF